MGTSFTFDESEYSEPADTAADEVLESLEDAVQEEQLDTDPELADVDLRLETADYYREILKHEFFDTTSPNVSPAAGVVDREIRVFIRERLEVLLGIRNPRTPESVAGQFEEDEVQALKIVAAKLLQKPGLIQDVRPTVKKMATPAPTPKPQAPQSRPKPQMKKIAAPAQAPSTKPKVKPQPVQPAKQAAKPQAKTNPNAGNKSGTKMVSDSDSPTPLTQTFKDVILDASGRERIVETTLVEGEVISEDGQRYQVVRNELGALYRKNITGQAMPTNRIPPMSAQQMSMYSQSQAESVVGAMDERMGLAVIASLTKE